MVAYNYCRTLGFPFSLHRLQVYVVEELLLSVSNLCKFYVEKNSYS